MTKTKIRKKTNMNTMMNVKDSMTPKNNIKKTDNNDNE